ncbi:hypothetical protein B0H63DRAFT_500485 [Podospora didyma]|uniref:AA1-like domain-containing protein n=1 Tax=Podospora didyma TaxID=330526 RepID=A0AAE0NSD9_9PEZI|nr:hypothetical protein B0H63DRAFT_500485 [Podospora didyma]
MKLSGGIALGALVLQVLGSPTAWRRQNWPDPTTGGPPRTSESCVEASLSDPKWGIYNPALVTVNGSSGGSMGDIRFLTINSASGVVANCTAYNIDLDPRGEGSRDLWHNCSIPNLQFQFNLEFLEMRLKGTWDCGNSSSLHFAANGTWETPLIQGCLDDWEAPRGQETLCIMGNSQVSSSLTSPIKIQPQLPIMPYTPSELPERCVDRSVDPEWEIDDLLYQHHYSQKNNVTKNYYDLFLNLTNISNNERVACSVTVDESKGSDASGSVPWVKCAPAVTSSNGNVSSTEVLLDKGYNIVAVRQTWNCTDGIKGIELDQYTGTGYLTSSLACGSPINLAITDKDGTVVGATSDYNCTLPATAGPTAPSRFSGYSPSPPTMPHTPYTRSCTIGSMINTTSLVLREYQIDDFSVPTPSFSLGTFSLYNPGSRDTYRLSNIRVIGSGAWQDCVPGPAGDPLPWQLATCQYLLDKANHRIGFKVSWYCDDRDPSHAVLFNATVLQELPTETCVNYYSSTTLGPTKTCRLPENAPEVVLPVSSLVWTTSAGPMLKGPTLPWV